MRAARALAVASSEVQHALLAYGVTFDEEAAAGAGSQVVDEDRSSSVVPVSSGSPAGLAAWLLVHPGFARWTYGEDPEQRPTRDEVLDDITLCWLTNSASSSARL